MHTKRMTTLLSLTIAAGTTLAFGFNADAPPKPDSTTPKSQSNASEDARLLSFHKVSSLMGSDVANSTGEVLGTISDLVVDRGTGEIGFVVLEHGGVLGLGSDQVAIPYNAFRLDRAQNRLRLGVTAAVMENSNRQTPPGWIEVDLDAWDDAVAALRNELLGSGDGRLRDPYDGAMNTDNRLAVEGVVESLDRDHIVDGPEQVIAAIRSSDGATTRVALGPSWFVAGQRDVIARGDRVRITAFALETPGTDLLVASELEADDLSVRLRDQDGSAKWLDIRPEQVMDTNEWVEPMVLMSDVIGMDAHALGEDSGEIEDAVMEASTGNVFMLSLDPNENILGIGDELRCVPWAIAAIGRERVRIDATEEMLQKCEPMPDDVQVFITPVRLQTAYSAFDVPADTFEPRPNDAWSEAYALGGWEARGPLAAAVNRGASSSVQGMLERMETTALPAGVSDAAVLLVRTNDRSMRVLVGPKWFMDRQDTSKIIGSNATVTFKEARVGGQTYRVATEIETDDGRVITLWRDGRPIWDVS